MNRIAIAVAVAASLIAAPAWAELRQLKQTIYGMD
jgi:hypothetical protein